MKIVNAPGQTCNKFWIYSNYIADSIETGEKLVILAPDISIKDYSNLLNSKYVSFPLYRTWITKIISYSFYLKILNYIFNTRTSLIIFKLVFSLIPRVYFIDCSIGSYISKNKIKYKNILIEHFTPNKEIVNDINLIFDSFKLKGMIVIGIHIRKGDYKSFKEGKYYYTNKQYHKFMLNLKDEFPNKKVTFFISSNEKIDLLAFSDCDCFSIPNGNSTKDLLALSYCNYIVGPPSTFSGWASFYKDVPIYFIENPELKITKHSFFQIMEIWD